MTNNYLTFEIEDGTTLRDLLQSNSIIQAFDQMVSNSKYSVYAITGGWGTGKSCFVKMWENMLDNNQQTFVHIDAFKMDYETEPFLMLINAFKGFMIKKNVGESEKHEWLNKAKKIFKLKNMAKLGFNVLLDKTIGSKHVEDFINNAYDSCFDSFTAEKSMYEEMTSSLVKITENFDKPVYIVIDELDRCRPDFALETLERIKHIFHIKNVKFILVYNDEIMQSIITQKYETGINAERYLTKFVKKTFPLDNTYYLIEWFHHEINNGIESYSATYFPDFLTGFHKNMLEVKNAFHLSLRDIQQLLSRLKQHKPSRSVNSLVVVTSVEFLKYIDKSEYRKMKDYYLQNKGFSSNAPDRVLYKKIFSYFEGQDLTITPDDAFTLYMKGAFPNVVNW